MFRVPSCENELVALFMKLEARGALPFPLFRVLEYTSREGLDALANIQWEEGSAPHKFAPVEFEYRFESFFDHGHPEKQVHAIVCWHSDDEAPGVPEGASFSWITEPFLGLLSYEGHQVRVLFVSRLPGIET